MNDNTLEKNKDDRTFSDEENSGGKNDYLHLGQGVKRESPPESQSEPENTSSTEEHKSPNNKEDTEPAIWSDRPTYDDQYTKYPQTTRHRGPYYAVFDLSDAASVLALNNFTDKQYPETAPHVIIAETTKQFSEKTDNWKVMVSYYTLQYRNLLLGKAPPP